MIATAELSLISRSRGIFSRKCLQAQNSINLSRHVSRSFLSGNVAAASSTIIQCYTSRTDERRRRTFICIGGVVRERSCHSFNSWESIRGFGSRSQKVNFIQRRKQHSGGHEEDKRKSDKEVSKKEDRNSILSQETRNQIWTQAQSIPNIITIARISSTPILCHFILTDQYKYAVTGCILAGFSDWLDGYIARKYNQTTVLGTYLDPFADKMFINSIAISLGYAEIIPLWCAGLWFGRDVLLIGMAYRTVAIATRGTGHNVADPSKFPLKIEPSMSSKINTVLQFGTISAGLGLAAMGDACVVAPISLGFMSVGPIEGMCYITCGTTVLSGLGYLDGHAVTKSESTIKR